MQHDPDLASMDIDQLKDEVQKLREAIRAQRDQSGHDLCWYVPELWSVLPEKIQPSPEIPDWCEFIQRCSAFRKSLESQKQ